MVEVGDGFLHGETVSDEVLPGLAEAIERRRLAVGLGKGHLASAAGLSREGLAPLLKGYRRAYNDSTIIGLARALRWEVDWYERLQHGEPPTEAEGSASEALDERLTRLEDEVREIRRMLLEIVGTPEDAPEEAGRSQ